MPDYHKSTVSIIMATYNRAHFIEETLTSIINQTYPYWECIIIDDGGTDNTVDVITPILESDSRFKFSQRGDAYQKGLPGCRNQGIALSKGEYIIFFDDDDIVHPENLKLCVDYLEQTKKDFCRYQRNAFTGDFQYNFHEKKEVAISFIEGRKDVGKMIMGSLPFNSCAVMWRKQCFMNNTFEESLMYAEEWECYSRILMCGGNGVTIDKVLFYGRKHPKSNTGEYQSKDPIRVKSKIKATRLIISNLNKQKLLDYTMSKYFLTLSKRLNDRSIYDHLMNQSTITRAIKNSMKIRYAFFNVYVLGYKIKNKLKY